METETITKHSTGTREEWLAARLKLLRAEKELTRQGDEVTQQRLALPWVRIDKKYRFDTDQGVATLKDLFQGRSQLTVYHLMYAGDWDKPCRSCSCIADGFDGIVPHLANHDVTLCAISIGPLAKLQAYKKRAGWSFPWASSAGSEFNSDFRVTFSAEQVRAGGAEYNFRAVPASDDGEMEMPGMSSFAIQDGEVYHTYSAYARGLDATWLFWQWLDRAPLGRNEEGDWHLELRPDYEK